MIDYLKLIVLLVLGIGMCLFLIINLFIEWWKTDGKNWWKRRKNGENNRKSYKSVRRTN